jgi:hypothetical protein
MKQEYGSWSTSLAILKESDCVLLVTADLSNQRKEE